MQCPKCKMHSGDDWKQCKGECPMNMSPHYKSNNLCAHMLDWCASHIDPIEIDYNKHGRFRASYLKADRKLFMDLYVYYSKLVRGWI